MAGISINIYQSKNTNTQPEESNPHDVRCRKTLDDSDIVDVKLYECTRTQCIESTDDNRDDMMT